MSSFLACSTSCNGSTAASSNSLSFQAEAMASWTGHTTSYNLRDREVHSIEMHCNYHSCKIELNVERHSKLRNRELTLLRTFSNCAQPKSDHRTCQTLLYCNQTTTRKWQESKLSSALTLPGVYAQAYLPYCI